VYFQNKNAVEIIDKQTGKLIDEIQYKGITSAPYYKDDMAYFMGIHENENALISYHTKKKKVNWAFPAPHDFNTPVYTSRYIFTRDSFDTPVTVSYDEAKPVYPAMYEQSCPFNTWNDMFFSNGNDYDDSVFYLNGFIYAVNYETGFLRKYLPTQYPVPVVSVTLNNFSQEMDFTYAFDKEVHVFYNHFGFQLITEKDIDSLKKIKPKKALLTPMPVDPLRKHDFFKIKSTTDMGSFNDFGSSKFIGIVDNQYMVFSQNDQLIGVSPKMGRTFNFPKTYFPVDKFWTQGNILYFYSESYNAGLVRVEMNRIWTKVELDQLKPPKEALDKYPHLQNKSE
jgi:acetoacetate decarboxylase